MLRNNHCRENKKTGIFICRGAEVTAEDNVCEKNGEGGGICVESPGADAVLRNNYCRENEGSGIIFCETK